MSIFRSTRHLSSSPETPITSTQIPAAAVSFLRSHRRKSRWNLLKSLLPPSSLSPSHSSSILLLLRNSPRLALRFFLWSLRHLPPSAHDLSSRCTIIHILARSRLVSPSLSLLRSLLRSHPPSSLLRTLSLTYLTSRSSPLVFDLLLRSLPPAPALSVLRSLLPRGFRPLTSTANSILRAAAKDGGSASALLLYRHLLGSFRPNPHTFNALLLALYRDGQTELNEEILAEMERFECRPNVLTFSIRIAGSHGLGEARRIWGEIVEEGVKPDAAAYNTMMKWCCDAGEVGEAEELRREMALGGVEATGTTLGLLMRGHCRVGGVEGAMAAYGEMRRKGFAAAEEVLDEMVEGMCAKGMVEEGLRVVAGSGRRGYEAVIKGLCKRGRMEEAGKLQAEMAGRGWGADERVYQAFICGYERAGEFGMVERLRKEMVQIQHVN